MDREQAFKQIREGLDFLEKSKEIVHLPDADILIHGGHWYCEHDDTEIGQDIKESDLADLIRYLVDMMA